MDEHNDNANRQDRIKAVMKKVTHKLKILYKQKLLPLERQYHFEDFHSPSWTDTDFDSKPIVLLVGQYSTGKTSFIRYLLERDFPGSNVGPEPTTDRFTAVMYGQTERIIPGNALAADRARPFTATTRFGIGFLNRFEAAICASPILKDMTFVDTPGVLSGEKQRVERSYNFPVVANWFAERADRILLLFDAHKLDISDEFRSVITLLRGDDDKIRCILNKADMEKQELLRVYGALMWSLGKVIHCPEVLRVYIGSFWSQPIMHESGRKLLKAEMRDLVADLRGLPRNSCIRRINELVKRSRMCKVHAHVISHLRDQFGWFNKEGTQEKLLQNLRDHMKTIHTKTGLPRGDFPNIKLFRNQLSKHKIWKFPRLNSKAIHDLDSMLSADIPFLMEELESVIREPEQILPEHCRAKNNPFDEDMDSALRDYQWVVNNTLKKKYDEIFFKQPLTFEQKLTGTDARDYLLSTTRIPMNILRDIWNLADIDGDGMLDSDEFAIAMFLIEQHKQQKLNTLPEELEPEWVPPSKHYLFEVIDDDINNGNEDNIKNLQQPHQQPRQKPRQQPRQQHHQ